MKFQLTLLTLIVSFLFYSSSFAKEAVNKKEKKTEEELRQEFKKQTKGKKTEAEMAAATALLSGCREKESYNLILKVLRFKKDMITISALNALGNCDDTTSIPRRVFLKELQNKKNSIFVRAIAAKKLSNRTVKTEALKALFATIKTLNLSNKIKRRKMGRSTGAGPGQNNPPENEGENTSPEDAAQQAALEQIKRNIQNMNDDNTLNPDGVKLSKLEAALLLADTCMCSIHRLTKEKSHQIKSNINGSTVTWWSKNKRPVLTWWKKNKNKYKKEDIQIQKELIAKDKAAQEKADKEKEAKVKAGKKKAN